MNESDQKKKEKKWINITWEGCQSNTYANIYLLSQ